MSALIVVLQENAEVRVYTDQKYDVVGLVDEAVEAENGEVYTDDFILVQPLKKLPAEYHRRFNIK